MSPKHNHYNRELILIRQAARGLKPDDVDVEVLKVQLRNINIQIVRKGDTSPRGGM